MDPAATPLVSILIPCFNAERWIKQAIESALEQSYPNTEVIVIDDGSEDGSLEIIKGFSEKIRWEARSNQGGNATRNRLLELSRGEWLQYLDADDYLLPGKIELQLGAVTQDVDVVYSPSLIERDGTREELEIPEPHDPWILLARWFLPQTGSPLWRKQAIVDVGGWSVDQPCCQEHELYFRLLANRARFQFCPHAESVYRKWSDDTVCERDPKLVIEQRLKIKARIEKHLESIDQLTPQRLNAINQARFELARSLWSIDRELARATIGTIRQSQPGFRPSGDAGPALYQLAFRTLGFGAAEHIAALVRP